jgi:hypothetical protein
MKVKSNVVEGFKPVEITITLESMEEAAELFAALNHAAVVNELEHLDCDKIRGAIRGALGCEMDYSSPFGRISESIKHWKH